MPGDYEFDGKSLVPFLSGKADKHRDWILSYNAQYQSVRTRILLRDGLGYFWDTRGTVDQEAYRLVPDDTSHPALQADVALIRDVFARYPSASTSGPMFERHMKEKAGKWALWERVQARVRREVEEARRKAARYNERPRRTRPKPQSNRRNAP